MPEKRGASDPTERDRIRSAVAARHQALDIESVGIEFTNLRLVDSGIVMVQKLKVVVERKAFALRCAVVLLGGAVVLSAAGTLFE